MRVFPSIPAAIVTGVVVMPVFLLGGKLIEHAFHSDLLMLLWGILAFAIPLFVSTADFRYVARRWRAVGRFHVLATREDFQQFYIPAWIRMAVWFASTVVAVCVLKAFGMAL